MACNNGQDVVVGALLQSEVSIGAQNNKGQTALHYAAFSHHGALCMELLVKARAPPNVQDNTGRTALHVTAVHGFYLRTESLITCGEQFGVIRLRTVETDYSGTSLIRTPLGQKKAS